MNPSSNTKTRVAIEILAWSLAIAAAVLYIASVRYRSRDPDSALYAATAARLAQEPVARWIAPEWWGQWRERGLEGYFREHPAGIFWLPAALGRLGYPAAQAAYAANAIYQALTVLIGFALARSILASHEARALMVFIQILPIAFTYRIRANHEQAVLLCVLLALWGAERSLKHLSGFLLLVGGLIGLMLVKGIFVMALIAACLLWILLRGRAEDVPLRGWWRAAVCLGLALWALAAAAIVYESAYRDVTGESFFTPYIQKQLGVAADPHSTDWATQKLYNLFWYAARVLYFPLPWSGAALIAVWVYRRRLWAATRESATMLATLAIAAAYTLAFSLSDRKADRYIFPVYTLIAMLGGAAWLRSSPRLARLMQRLDTPYFAALVYIGLIVLHVTSGRLHLPRIKFWPSD